MGDMDIGDMFHNFMLHERVQVLAGIDLTSFYPAELTGEVRFLWERWKRSAMGLKNSPYNTIQGVLFAEEVIRGDHLNKKNVFRWDAVRLNLPGSPTYMPHLSWVSKIRSHDGSYSKLVGYTRHRKEKERPMSRPGSLGGLSDTCF